jgi:hypothetical protein
MPRGEQGVTLFRSEDVGHLTLKLEAFLAGNSRKQFAENGRSLVMREFGPAKIGAQAEHIYSDVLSGGKQRAP